jgi:hypothetical protein
MFYFTEKMKMDLSITMKHLESQYKMSQNLSFAQNIATQAKKRFDEMKDALLILNNVFATIMSKIEAYDCHWDNTFTIVRVNVGTKLPLTIISVDDFVTTMSSNHYKFLVEKFSEFGFTLGEIYYEGPMLKCLDLHVKKNEK